MKTLIAPGLKSRMLGLNGWFSTNILGNRDGEVLDDPGSFQSKEVTKSRRWNRSCSRIFIRTCTSDFYHKVRIEYYPPRGDAKEGWDNIDIFGWLGYPMQIKINFLCRDSILAAPLVLDIVLFMDLGAARRDARHPGMAVVLLQGAHARARPLSRARHLHPVHEAEEYAALDAGRRPDHAPGPGILRLIAVSFWLDAPGCGR